MVDTSSSGASYPRDNLADLESNKQAAINLLQAIAHVDMPMIDKILHPDATWWLLGVGTLDRATLIDAVVKTFGPAIKRDYRVIGIIAEDNRVAVETEGEFHYPDHVYRNSYHVMLAIENGQVVMVREYMDPRMAF